MGRNIRTAETPYDRIVLRMREKWPTRYPEKKQVPQRHIAQLAGVQQPSVTKWKRGGPIDRSNIIRLAVHLDVATEWLETGRGQKFPGPANDPLLEQIWRLVTSMDESHRMEVAQYAAYLVEQTSRKLG